MREYEPTPAVISDPGIEEVVPWWALRDQTDLSLSLGHGADAPDPADLGEPEPVRALLRSHVEHRISRRQAMAAGAAGLTAVVASTAAAGPAGAGFRHRGAHPWRGDAAALSAAVDVGYLRRVTESLTAFGDTPDGWRPGGSPASLQAVDWIAKEMRSVGLRHVAKLPVPIDRWVFRGASVEVDGGPTSPASSWGGVPGTPAGGITAEVLDLGLGQASNYEDVDATGKIVLVDWAFGDYWVNRHGHQATLEGALAVIFYTGTTAAGAFYNQRDDGLMSFDGTYDDDWVPFVFVTRNAANDLISRIAAGPTTVTVTSNVELTRAEDGGVGYNVLGAIPGTDRSAEQIIFTGHHDAWFRGAADDATAIAAMLAIAKSIRDTGFRPRRTLLFLASTNEEYGYTDAYYEWLVGCWYAITHQRPGWSESAILSLDFELLGTGDPGERLLIRTHAELLAHAVEHLESDPSRTPFGTLSQNTVWANADHFTLTAAGIPGLYFNTVGTSYLTRNYHTNYDVVENVNFDYLAQNVAVINDIWVDHDRSSLPILDFVARATEATARTAYEAEPGVTLGSLPGVNQASATRLAGAVDHFSEAAAALDARLSAGKGLELTSRREADAHSRADDTDQADCARRLRPVRLPPRATAARRHQDAARHHRTGGRRPADGQRQLRATHRSHQPRTAVRLRGVRRRAGPSRTVVGPPPMGRSGASERLRRPVAGVPRHRREEANGLTDPADYAAETAAIRHKLQPVYHQLNHRLRSMASTFELCAHLLWRATRAAH